MLFTRDGRRLLAATRAFGCGWFDVVERKPLGNSIKQFAVVANVTLSPDEKTILTAAGDGAIRRWDAATGQNTGITQEQGASVGMRQSRNGERLVSATPDARLWLWNQNSTIPLIAPRRMEAGITALDINANGQRILTATGNGAVTVWRAALPCSQPLLFSGGDGLCMPAMNPQGTLVLTGDGNTITRWDAQTGRRLTPTAEHPGRLRSLTFSPDGSRFVSGTLDGHSARVWDARTGESAGGPFPATGYVDVAFLSADNKLIGVVGRSNNTRVWNTETGQPVTGKLGKNTQSGAFGGSGKLLALMMDRVVTVWNLANGTQEIGSVTSKSTLRHLAVSLQGNCFATALSDGVARVWSFESAQPLSPPLVHRNDVLYSAFSSDGKLLATASADGTARIWEWANGRMLTEPLRHGDMVYTAEFSPHGRQIATGSSDSNVRVWDTASGRPLTELLPTAGRPYRLQWSADGRRLFAKCEGGSNPLWQLPEVTARAPEWLSEWAEAIGGQRLDESGKLSEVGFEEYQRFRGRADSLAGSDVYGEALRWFFETGPDRAIAPGSRVTAKDQAQRSP